MPLKWTQPAIFEASAKTFPDGSKTPTCLTAICGLDVWTDRKAENGARGDSTTTVAPEDDRTDR